MTPALPERIVTTLAVAAAVLAGAQFSGAPLAAQDSQAGDRVILAIYESPLQKWKRQCRRAGGKYEKYCAGGVKHCCCYSAGYCEGIPEPVDANRQPALPSPGSGGTSAPSGGAPARRVR